MSQKFENILNLALETPQQIREKTNNLNVGFEEEGERLEVIVKYHGSLAFLTDSDIVVEELIAGYAILNVPQSRMEELASYEEIEYVEMPKRFYFEQELPSENGCFYPLTVGELSLTGRDNIIAILDSGERVIIMSS